MLQEDGDVAEQLEFFLLCFEIFLRVNITRVERSRVVRRRRARVNTLGLVCGRLTLRF